MLYIEVIVNRFQIELTDNKRDKYNYFWGEGLIGFNSLSPNGKYYYQITRPKDLYWGLFVARISFCSINGELIYYDKESYASPLQSELQSPIQYALFINSGNMVYYQQRRNVNQVFHILIDLSRRTFKKKKWSEGEERILTQYLKGDNTIHIPYLFKDIEWIEIDRVDSRKSRNLVFRKIWYPVV